MIEFFARKSVENKLPREQVLKVSEQALISLVIGSFMVGVFVTLGCGWLGLAIYDNLSPTQEKRGKLGSPEL